MTSESIPSVSSVKAGPTPPPKPWDDFPLFAHRNGSWMTTARHEGRHVPMGGWRQDPQGRKAYARWKKWIRTGERDPDIKDIRLEDLANDFLAAKAREHAAGQLSPRTYRDYRAIVCSFIQFMGPQRFLGDLKPAHFARYRQHLLEHGSRRIDPANKRGRPPSRLGPHALNRHVVSIRHLLAWAEDTDLVERAPKIRRVFEPLPVAITRKHRAETERDHGKKIFTAAEVRKLLANADVIMRAQILLGLNGGFGNTDIARLEKGEFDFKRKCYDSLRPKTQVRRIVPLWPETLSAVKAAMIARAAPATTELANRVFLTRGGVSMVEERVIHSEDDGLIIGASVRDWVEEGFSDLLDECKLRQRGRDFYSLRRTFRTLADAVRDDRACAVIMGHSVGDVAELYIWEVGKARLQTVVNYVHRKLAPLLPQRKVTHA